MTAWTSKLGSLFADLYHTESKKLDENLQYTEGKKDITYDIKQNYDISPNNWTKDKFSLKAHAQGDLFNRWSITYDLKTDL